MFSIKFENYLKLFQVTATEATGFTLVDEDNLPVAFLCLAHVDSYNKAPSDVESNKGEESV